MPAFNQKGPEGQGPMTGRKMGRCTNFGAGPGQQNAKNDYPELREGRHKNKLNEETDARSTCLSGFGPGQGKGRGLGQGFGRGSGKGLGQGRGNGRGAGLQD